MNLEQAKELERLQWEVVLDEAYEQRIDLEYPRYTNFRNAIKAWAEYVADVRSLQSVEDRIASADINTQRYLTEKKV